MHTGPGMKSLFQTLWPHAVHLIVGGVFLYAGAVKIMDPHGFAKNVYHYQLLPDLWVNLSALIMPWLELVTGAALIFQPRWRRGAAAWIFLMLFAFTGAVLSGMMRGLDISCGCLSTSPDAAKIGWRKVAENTGLMILCALAYFRAAPPRPKDTA